MGMAYYAANLPPRNRERLNNVDANGSKVDTDVSHRTSQEHDKEQTYDAERKAEDAENASLLDPVGPDPKSHRDDARSNTRRRRQQVRLQVAPSKGTQDGGLEDRDGVGSCADGQVQHAAAEDLPVLERVDDALGRHLLVRHATVVSLKPADGPFLLGLGEKGAVLREGRHIDPGEQGGQARDSPLHEENPLPPRDAAHAVERAQAGAQQARDGAGDVVGDEEEGHAGEQLVPLVPAGNQIHAPGKHARLEDADENSRDEQAGKVLAESSKCDRHYHGGTRDVSLGCFSRVGKFIPIS